MGVIQDLRDEKELVLFHDYRNNQAVDESTYEHNMTAHTGTLTDTEWDGRGLTFPENTSVVDVADSDDIQLTGGCLVVFCGQEILGQSSNEYLFSKRDAGGTNYQWFITSTGCSFYDGASTRTITASLEHYKTLAVNFDDAGTPELFGDGGTLGSFSGTVAVSVNDAPLEIGNYNDANPFQSSLQAALIVNRELTADEHSDLHDELVARFAESKWDDAQDRLLSQYQNSTNVKKLIESIFNRVDNVDYMLRYLQDYTNINTACGVWLDIVGDIVGIPRPHIEQSYGNMFAFKPVAEIGSAWETQSSAADLLWLATAYSPDLGLYAAVASSGTGNRVMTSPDGITWTSRTSAADNNWCGLAWGNGVFVAVADSGANRVMTSPDGITWTARACTANAWSSVVWDEDVGLFVAVAYSGAGNRVQTSPDGITWTIRASAANNTWLSVTRGAGLFVAVSSDGAGNNVMTSPDGVTWTLRACQNNTWRAVTYGDGLFVAVANAGSGNRVQISHDGITWTSQSTDDDSNWRAITYAGDRFVAVADNSGTTSVATSSKDGIHWTTHQMPDANSWRAVTYGGCQVVAVGIGGTGYRATMSSESMLIDDPYKAFV